MALRNKPGFEAEEPNTTTAQDDGGFEQCANTGEAAEASAAAATAAATKTTTNATAANEPQHQETATALAPAKPQGGAVSAQVGAGRFKPALADLQNVINPASLEFDTFRRITVGLDGFSDENETELGKKVKISVMSWNERFVVSPGVQSAEANEKVKYSLDGHVCDDGTPVADYLKVLKDVEGYDKAAVKKYLTIYGFLIATSADGKDLVDIPAEDREIVAVQVPPRSLPLFTRFQIEQGVKISSGILQPSDEMVLTQEKVKGKTTTYASIKFSAK